MTALKVILIVLGAIFLYQALIRIIRKLYHFPAPAFIGRFLDSDIRRWLQPADKLIERSGIRSTGFNGVMYSVLEDPRLGVVSSEEGKLSIESLLAFSTMCGCGIDMVPLPGDVSAEEVASVMLDIAAVAIRLNKPLGVRLLPIPGKSAGELTNFDHDFLHNTRIQELRGRGCVGDIFGAAEPFAYL